MFNFFSFLNPVKTLRPLVEEINNLEKEILPLSSGGLLNESNQIRDKIKGCADSDQQKLLLEEFLPRAFALTREAAKRTLGQRHFDVQLMGGIILHQGKIAEMSTGEGKTLASTAPVYLNALTGKGVHVVTVNEYLAKRDAVWMGQIYNLLGLSVACLVHDGALIYDPFYISKNAEGLIDKERDTTGSFLVQDEYLRPISRKEAYAADITYGTNHEFGFDYLRDNLAYSKEAQTQRGHYFAIVDEIDSILIDEARTPLIIAAPDAESSDFYKVFSRIVSGFKIGEDYTTDEKLHSADITSAGIDKVEKALKIDNIYAPENLRLTHYLQEILKAYGLFKRDKDYVVKNGEIIIVDQFTGRLMQGRRYSNGLHQAIEAKEGLVVQNESRTFAQITIQNYFRLYKKLSGMTGTAQTSAEEFAVTEEIKKRQQAGQPVLVGTISIEKNEALSDFLGRAGVKHEILNAKNNEREGAIIAQAGRMGAVTLATNMAGRGVDIILGGNPPNPVESEKVKNLGGLHVIGTERHEARRIDNQLRGRSGRQGDPGSSLFFLSLEDDLLRIFGGGRIKSLMESFNIPDDTPIESKIVSKSVSQAQAKVEGFNFDARKNLLDYDDILNKQRIAIYKKRQDLLEGGAHPQILAVLDFYWMNHLENMESLRESVHIRAYGQHDPLVEYRRESHLLFRRMNEDFEKWLEQNKNILLARPDSKESGLGVKIPAANNNPKYDNVGRNDPCPCGSGKKYKKCHGV
ncbi:MAG: preprotein translocase subunit SecA [Parcubacteria group bacterium Athens0714_26]|nr:MAG: preprotein translocase subunit SecA [Parcubacteria group bacterium Athens0714_26]